VKKNRVSPSFLMVFGFILFVLCAIALPSAAESSRPIVIAGALGSAGLIVGGFLLSIFGSRNSQRTEGE
jgi:hypothetical protein